MLYVGHFSFADTSAGANEAPWHGLLTLVAEGKNVEVAIRKFDRLIRDLARRQDFLDGVKEIYLDTCVELRTVPRNGVLTYVTLREGEDTGGISACLLGASARVGASYGWGTPRDAESTEPRPMKPFIRLRRQKRAKKLTEAQPDKSLRPSPGPDTVH